MSLKLLKNLPSKINLIPFNPFPHAPYGRSSRNRIIAFQKTLSDAGFVCTIRQTRGDDIDAACGQLVNKLLNTECMKVASSTSTLNLGEILISTSRFLLESFCSNNRIAF